MTSPSEQVADSRAYAEVSGGTVEKLVQISSAQNVHVYQPAPARLSVAVPAELPPDAAAFIGRESELDRLERLFDPAMSRPAPILIVFDGPGGVGKSALAVHAAHRFASRFPDGQLYVNLQGSAPGREPLDPAEVLGRFLRALGVDGKEVPVLADEATTRLRSLVSAKKMLFVLDNAAAPGQVRPLLPAGGGCAVIVTSREVLATLDNAVHFHLDVLSPDEAVELLTSFTGSARTLAEPDATNRIVLRCGLLPLAIRIAGARLAARPNWPLIALADRLGDERTRLNELQLGDLAVRASFSVSYAALAASDVSTTMSASRMFRLMGLLDAPDISDAVAVALADGNPNDVGDAIARLLDAQLLEEYSPGRYRMHDLLRLFAREHANSEDAEYTRDVAVRRVLEFYLTTARHASRLLQPTDPRRTVGSENSTADFLTDRATALAWLESERHNIVAIMAQAAHRSDILDPIVAHIADAMFWFCHQRVYTRELDMLNQLSLGAAERLGLAEGQSQCLHNLCISNLRLRRYQDAIRFAERALALRRASGDRYGEARTLDALGRVHFALHQYSEAIAYGEESLAIAREISDPYSESAVLCNLVPAYQAVGRNFDAIRSGERSLAIRSGIGDRYGEGRMRISLGQAYQASGRVEEGIACCRQSLTIFQDIGLPYYQARVLLQLAAAHREAASLDEALACAEQCIVIRRETSDLYGEAEALLLRAQILRDIGHEMEAADAEQQGAELLRGLDMPVPAWVYSISGDDGSRGGSADAES